MSKLLCLFIVYSLIFSINGTQNNSDEDEFCSNLSAANKNYLNEEIEANEKMISDLELKLQQLQNVETQATYYSQNLEAGGGTHSESAYPDGGNEFQTTTQLQREVQNLQKRLQEKEIQVEDLQRNLETEQFRVNELLVEKEIQVEQLQRSQNTVMSLQKELEEKQVLLDLCQLIRKCLAGHLPYLNSNDNELSVNQTINIAGVQLQVQLVNRYPYNSPWIVVLQRFDKSVNFNRGWKELKNGIGSVEGEYFIGLQNLHLLTKLYRCELRVYMKHIYNVYNAYYDNFVIGSEDEGYVLKKLGEYSGNAGNCLISSQNTMFTTLDRGDNYSFTSRNIPWWGCTDCNLFSNDPFWNDIQPRNSIYMMIRPISPYL